MTYLVIGKSGQVARALAERAGEGRNIVAVGRPELDIRSPDSIAGLLGRVRPDVVINASAYTAVDQAETEEDEAFRVNRDGPAALATLCEEAGIPLIHYSTDYVFDGTGDGYYAETDPAAPLGVYGRSKRAGEEAVADGTRRHVILRTAWVYSPFGGNFVKTMLRLARDREVLTVVADQTGCPTSALDIADATLIIADNLAAGGDKFGVYHLAGTGETSWHGFAQEIMAVSAAAGGPSATVEPIPTSAYPTPAKRPANSRLDCTKLAKDYGLELPDWRESTRACVMRLIKEGASA